MGRCVLLRRLLLFLLLLCVCLGRSGAFCGIRVLLDDHQ